MDILENSHQEKVEKETPPQHGQVQEGLGHCGEGVVVVFLTLDQLRLHGPLALREWLKRTHRLPRTTGQVVAFHHQEALGTGGTE